MLPENGKRFKLTSENTGIGYSFGTVARGGRRHDTVGVRPSAHLGTANFLGHSGARQTDPFNVGFKPSGFDFFTDAPSFCHSEIMIVFEVDPELRGQSEICPRQSRVGANRPISSHDFIDARNATGVRSVLTTIEAR